MYVQHVGFRAHTRSDTCTHEHAVARAVARNLVNLAPKIGLFVAHTKYEGHVSCRVVLCRVVCAKNITYTCGFTIRRGVVIPRTSSSLHTYRLDICTHLYTFVHICTLRTRGPIWSIFFENPIGRCLGAFLAGANKSKNPTFQQVWKNKNGCFQNNTKTKMAALRQFIDYIYRLTFC